MLTSATIILNDKNILKVLKTDFKDLMINRSNHENIASSLKLNKIFNVITKRREIRSQQLKIWWQTITFYYYKFQFGSKNVVKCNEILKSDISCRASKKIHVLVLVTEH